MAIPLMQGVGQMTPAQQHTVRKALGTARASGRKVRRSRKAGGKKKRAAAAAPRRKKRAAAKGGKPRLVKGSAAAKAYMAKIRKMRKR